MYDFTNLIKRKRDLEVIYTDLSRRYAADSDLTDKLTKEYRILLKLIDAGQKGFTLEEASKKAGTSIDSARRWSRGKLPYYLNHASKKSIDLEKLQHNENFIFLLGVYQSQKVAGVDRVSFSITAKDEPLKQTLETCMKSCFGEEAKKSEQKGRNSTEYYVDSMSLMTMVKDLTNDNTSPPTTLFITENKRGLYYSGFLTNIKICKEHYRTKQILHASLSRSRGDLIASVHSYLEENKIPHSYDEKRHRIRFRKKECIDLTEILPKSTAERIRKMAKSLK